MDTVPAELLLGILRFLDLDDLRRAAAVSRAFYESAWLSGLFIPRTLYWYSNRNYDADLVTLNDIVHHALLKGLRLGFTFGTFGVDGTVDGDTVDGSPTPPEAIFAFVSAALPVLRALSLSVHARLFPSLANALRSPAPNLRELTLGVLPTHITPFPEVPANIIGGTAPKLREVELRNVRLAGDAISAFSQASPVHIEYIERTLDVDLALHFPAVRNLRLGFFKAPGAVAPIPYKIDGLSLRKLTFYEDYPPMLVPAMLQCNTLERIPDILYWCSGMQCEEQLWEKSDEGPFSVRLAGAVDQRQPATVVVVPDHRHWRRAFILEDGRMPWQCPITAIPNVSTRLSYLRMRNFLVAGLLQYTGLRLNALRTLRIDFDAESPLAAMLWPPDWSDELGNGPFLFGPLDTSTPTFARESYSYIACGALQTIVLFAVSGEVNISSQEVAFLGRALSQCTRPAQDRAALELAGIALREAVAHTLLDQTFSAVLSDGFSGRDNLPDHDDEFWGDELY